MLDAVLPRAPFVPRLDQIQDGYEAVQCHERVIDGSTVRLFTVPGQATAGPGTTLVAIPGLGASGRSFALMSPLAQQLRLLFWTPPLRTPAKTTPLAHNVGLLAHRDAGLPAKFVLLGSSFGSLVALAFAAQHPDRVHALILANPVASTRRIRRGAMAASTFLRVPLPFAYLFAPMVARVLGGRRLPNEGRAEIVRESRRMSPVEMARRLKDILTTDLLGQLDRIDVPTLVIHGRSDHLIPRSAARDVAARMPRARFEVIRGAGHLPYMSHPDTFNALVAKFLTEIGPC